MLGRQYVMFGSFGSSRYSSLKMADRLTRALIEIGLFDLIANFCNEKIDDETVSKLKAQSQYDAYGAPVRDPGSTGMNRGSTGMNQGSAGDDRDEPGTTENIRGSTGKVLKCLIPPG
ncbi:hypothetical protein DPMN_000241 [Dreissena polymorpha]|uniref:Uncharacterized protein n=1 Tax=Dreissena polymorpha TaxID=45954 RepID=A0A9D4MJ98_DREPO|nr:hypothetical protein DPMN_000241 [Dreissena polymorpha]